MAEVLLAAAAFLVLLVAACGAVAARAGLLRGLSLLQMANVLGILVLVVASRGFGESFLFTTAWVLAVVSLPGTLVYAHFLERWR